MSFITSESELLDAIRHRTAWVAECLQRINRFNGQHPTSNVLNHSLDVMDRVRDQCPDARPEVLAWACLHDVHELLSGDIARMWKSPSQEQRQDYLDLYLVHNLELDMDSDEEALIRNADIASGKWEHDLWDKTPYAKRLKWDVWRWCEIVEAVVK